MHPVKEPFTAGWLFKWPPAITLIAGIYGTIVGLATSEMTDKAFWALFLVGLALAIGAWISVAHEMYKSHIEALAADERDKRQGETLEQIRRQVAPDLGAAAGRVANVGGLSDQALKARVLNFVTRILEFEQAHRAEQTAEYMTHMPYTKENEAEFKVQWDARNARDNERRMAHETAWKRDFQPEGVNLKSELYRRLGIDGNPPGQNFASIALDFGLAGPTPINDAAIYLQTLAAKLPE